MSTRVPVEKATFTALSGGGSKQAIPVHFNPVSLQYTLTNTLKEEGSGKTKKQYVTQGTGKLTMDLVFDSTHNGQDVRLATAQIAVFMEPDKKSSGTKQVPAILIFEWGAYKFKGMMESYKETLDFFSADGVPLRASVNISLVQQDKVFSEASADTRANMGGPGLQPDAVDVPTGSPGGGGNQDNNHNAQSAATLGGDPGAARALAALNGQESMRFSAGASLTVSGSVQLGPPVAFATGGAGIGISGGAGLQFGAGASASASLGTGLSASAGGGASLFGSAGSAGVTATEGAFAGLRVSAQPPSFALNTNNFLPPAETATFSTDHAAGFQVGGQATIEGAAGLTTDVGATADLNARIQFEG